MTDRVVNQLLTLIDGADATMGGITGDEDNEDEDEDEDDDDSDEIGQRKGGHEKSSNQVSHTFFFFFYEKKVLQIILNYFK